MVLETHEEGTRYGGDTGFRLDELERGAHGVGGGADGT